MSNILNYIPQRPPFVMIDTLTSAKGGIYTTTFFIESNNIFNEAGLLSSLALIENIGQTALAGIAFELEADASVPRNGFLGGISKLNIFELPKINSTLKTVVERKATLANMYLIQGRVYCNDKLLIEGDLQLTSE